MIDQADEQPASEHDEARLLMYRLLQISLHHPLDVPILLMRQVGQMTIEQTAHRCRASVGTVFERIKYMRERHADLMTAKLK